MPFIKIIYWYLGREITNKSIIVALWLLVVYLFLSLLDELEGGGHKSTADIAISLGYSIPRMIYELSPIILLIGTILGLSVLVRQNELIAFQAGGVSKARLVVSVLGYSAIFATGIFLWGEVVVPYTENQSAELKLSGKGGGSAINHGVWIRNGNNFIFLDEVDRLKHLKGVYIYQFDSDGRYVGQIESRAGLVSDNFDSLELRGVKKFELNDKVLQKEFSHTKGVPIEFDALTLALQPTNPAALNILELYEWSSSATRWD